jgi:hypothetical protein
MSNESFDVNFTDVPLINQLTNMSCWAASAAMVVGWRDRLSIDPAAIAAGTGIWSAYTNGLAPGDIPSLATAWGLTMEPPQSYTSMVCATWFNRKDRYGLRQLSPASTPLP